MPSGEVIIQLATLAAAIVLGFLLKDFFPSYSKEKGKNLATKCPDAFRER